LTIYQQPYFAGQCRIRLVLRRQHVRTIAY
jgi:hypothetical protein